MYHSGKYQKLIDSQFQRITGLKKNQFFILANLLDEYIKSNWSTRGRQDSKFDTEDRLLICLRYLRDYQTFLVLGAEFGISESYAYKIFTKVSLALVKILKLPSLDNLNLQTIIIDVTEQRTERPKKTNINN
jgi:hypothetical protein